MGFLGGGALDKWAGELKIGVVKGKDSGHPGLVEKDQKGKDRLGGGSRNDRRLGSEWNLSLYDFRGAAVLGDNKAPGVAVRTDG